MIYQEFTYKEFKKLQHRGDFFTPTNESKKIDEKLHSLEEKLKNFENYQFESIKSREIDGKKIYFLDEKHENFIQDTFTLRKIDHIIKRIYKVKQTNRDVITAQIKTLLEEKMPCFIYRMDISSFYESIDKKEILDKIENSSLISVITKKLLENVLNHTNEQGIPRGLNISASLSELYMQKFDSEMKAIDGIYYYSRFVDDIIIFSYKELDKTNLEEILQKRTKLTYNKNKYQEIRTSDIGENHFTYLGYEYIYSHFRDSKDKIKINIAPEKIKKIKSRIIYSLLDYNKKQNYKLLKRRLLFLSCTYPIKTAKQKISKYKNLGYLQAGLLYNYCNLTSDSDSLKELDKFFSKVLFGNNIYTSKLTKVQKKELIKYSFVVAYNRKITRNYHLNFKEFNQIARCWKYA